MLSEHGAGNPLAATVYGSFDAVDNRTSKTGPDHAESYTYDVLDRLVRVDRTGEGAGESFFEYDGIGNRLNASFLPPRPGVGTYSYDPNGNLISKVEDGVIWTYEWDALNHLIVVRRDGAEAARFGYDALGRRVSKTAGGLTTRYTYDGEDILKETRSDGTSYTYIHGPGIDEPLARQDGAGARQYYLADGLGSILKMVGPGGETILARRYDAWGNLEAGADQPGYAFTGREWDPEIGLYYYRARYYDPKIGRFISEDPIGFAAGPNFYSYVRGNPARFVDPFGLEWSDTKNARPSTAEYWYSPALWWGWHALQWVAGAIPGVVGRGPSSVPGVSEGVGLIQAAEPVTEVAYEVKERHDRYMATLCAVSPWEAVCAGVVPSPPPACPAPKP